MEPSHRLQMTLRRCRQGLPREQALLLFAEGRQILRRRLRRLLAANCRNAHRTWAILMPLLFAIFDVPVAFAIAQGELRFVLNCHYGNLTIKL